MKKLRNSKIWYFDVDDTLILWDKSKYPHLPILNFTYKSKSINITPHQRNINLLVKLSKIGWYIRVYSGSGADWAEIVVKNLGIEQYVDSVECKPQGITDDKGPGDGLTYVVYKEP